jgi:hypothetical protein
VQHDATDKHEAARDNYSFPYGGYPLLLLLLFFFFFFP